MTNHLKLGFIGAGNLTQVFLKAIVENKILPTEQIFVSNRSIGKLHKVQETFGVHTATSNDELVENCDIVVIATKPQDLSAAIEPISSLFNQDQIVISLAAGITIETLEKLLPQCRIARLMPNTPTTINRGVLGYCVGTDAESVETVIEDLFSSLGYVLKVEDEDQLEALTVSCASGTGFVFELMLYWQEWLEEHGFNRDISRKITVETFLGASLLASQSNQLPLEDLLAKVTSKKGVTQAGLESMRELEIERALRYSFEKAALRNQELGRESRKNLLS